MVRDRHGNEMPRRGDEDYSLWAEIKERFLKDAWYDLDQRFRFIVIGITMVLALIYGVFFE